MGYSRAGFDEIVGVDIKPQPRYPFTFVQGDWLTLFMAHALKFDAIHASPPCQRYTRARVADRDGRPDLVPSVRALLMSSGVPWVMENVPGAPMVNAIQLCGLALGLRVKRHRWFECSHVLMSPPCPSGHVGEWYHVSGNGSCRRTRTNSKSPRREPAGIDHARQVMGIDWMPMTSLSQAIPPAYTEYIGKQLLAQLKAEVA